MVIEVLVQFERLVNRGEVEFAEAGIPKFNAGGSVGSLHNTIELGTPWGQDIQGDVSCCTSLLKFSHKFTAPIHLYGQGMEVQR